MDWHSIFDQARADVVFLLPEALLVFFGLATLLTDFLLAKPQKSWNALTSMLGIVFSGASLCLLVRPAAGHLTVFANSIVIDPFFIFFGLIVLVSAAFAILFSGHFLEIEDEQHGEYYALILFAAMSMMFVACANDLVVIFIALEALAISFYVLTGYLRHRQRSAEAAMKYMLTGAFGAAILAYGFSILYGIAGSTNLQAIQAAIVQRHADFPSRDLLTFLALATITAGALIKVAAVPFHQWAPDVFEGAPPPIAAYVGVASFAIGFALLLRMLLNVFWIISLDWVAIMSAAGLLSLTLGTLAAITQTSIKRLLAYSSIAQSGYILLGLAASVNRDGSLHERGLQAVAFYIFAYAFFNTGAFAVIVLLRHKNWIGDEIEDLQGLLHRNPAAAIFMLIFLLSLAGIPFTAGFIAKLLILWSLLEAGHPYLAVAAALYILPGVYYYFRIVAAMWSSAPGELPQPFITVPQKFALTAVAAVTLLAGIFPEHFLQFAKYSITASFAR